MAAVTSPQGVTSWPGGSKMLFAHIIWHTSAIISAANHESRELVMGFKPHTISLGVSLRVNHSPG